MAQRLVTDPAYQKNLLTRLRQGKAGAIEATLWSYAYGRPKETVSVDGGSGGRGGDVRREVSPGAGRHGHGPPTRPLWDAWAVLNDLGIQYRLPTCQQRPSRQLFRRDTIA